MTNCSLQTTRQSQRALTLGPPSSSLPAGYTCLAPALTRCLPDKWLIRPRAHWASRRQRGWGGGGLWWQAALAEGLSAPARSGPGRPRACSCSPPAPLRRGSILHSRALGVPRARFQRRISGSGERQSHRAQSSSGRCQPGPKHTYRAANAWTQPGFTHAQNRPPPSVPGLFSSLHCIPRAARGQAADFTVGGGGGVRSRNPEAVASPEEVAL